MICSIKSSTVCCCFSASTYTIILFANKIPFAHYFIVGFQTLYALFLSTKKSIHWLLTIRVRSSSSGGSGSSSSGSSSSGGSGGSYSYSSSSSIGVREEGTMKITSIIIYLFR